LHSSDEQDKLVSQSHEESYLLNPMAVFIWTFCDGKTEVRAIRNQEEVAKDLMY